MGATLSVMLKPPALWQLILLLAGLGITADCRGGKPVMNSYSSITLKRQAEATYSYYEVRLSGNGGNKLNCDTGISYQLTAVLTSRRGDFIASFNYETRTYNHNYCSWYIDGKLPLNEVRKHISAYQDSIRVILFQQAICGSRRYLDTAYAKLPIDVPQELRRGQIALPIAGLRAVTENARPDTSSPFSGVRFHIAVDQKNFRKAIQGSREIARISHLQNNWQLHAMLDNGEGQRLAIPFGVVPMDKDTLVLTGFAAYHKIQSAEGLRNCRLVFRLSDADGMGLCDSLGSISLPLVFPRRSLVYVRMHQCRPAADIGGWELVNSAADKPASRSLSDSIQYCIRYGDDEIGISGTPPSYSGGSSHSQPRFGRNVFAALAYAIVSPFIALAEVAKSLSRSSGRLIDGKTYEVYYYKVPGLMSSIHYNDSNAAFKKLDFTVYAYPLPVIDKSVPVMQYGIRNEYKIRQDKYVYMKLRIEQDGTVKGLPPGSRLTCTTRLLGGETTKGNYYAMPDDVNSYLRFTVDSTGKFVAKADPGYSSLRPEHDAIRFIFLLSSGRGGKQLAIDSVTFPLKKVPGWNAQPKTSALVYSDTVIEKLHYRKAAFDVEMPLHFLMAEKEKLFYYQKYGNAASSRYDVLFFERNRDTAGAVLRERLELCRPYAFFTDYSDSAVYALISVQTRGKIESVLLQPGAGTLEKVVVSVEGRPRNSGYRNVIFSFRAGGEKNKRATKPVLLTTDSLPYRISFVAHKDDPVFVYAESACNEHWFASDDVWLDDLIPPGPVRTKKFHCWRIHDRGRWKGLRVSIKREPLPAGG